MLCLVSTFTNDDMNTFNSRQNGEIVDVSELATLPNTKWCALYL